MYLRMKAADRDTLTAALRACDAGFVIEVPAADAPSTALQVTTQEGTPPADVTRYYVIVGASHRHSIIHGLPNMVAVRAVKNQAGKVITPAVKATGYHADIAGDAVTSAVRETLEANGVSVFDDIATPQHVLG